MSSNGNPTGADQRQEIRRLVAGTLPVLDQQGIVRRSFLLGLWQGVIGTLLDLGEPTDVSVLLIDRAMVIYGHGRNADSPPLALTEDARVRRLAEASLAARIILDALEPYTSSLDDQREERFPEDFLEVTLEILCEAWGPSHVRAALRDQVRAISEGDLAPILPAEPATLNYIPKQARSQEGTPSLPDAPAIEAAPAEPVQEPEPAPPPPRRRSPSGRMIDIHIDSDIVENGHAVYAIACQITDPDGRREIREISGVVPDATGRLAPLVAAIDVLSSLDRAGDAESVRVSSPSKALIEGALNPAARSKGDAARWETVERHVAGRHVEWVASKMGIGSDLAQRCDRLVRQRAEQFSKETAA